MLPIPDGERAKTAAVAASCWEALGEAGFTRSDAVVTFGGGATTDLGGFVAATWLRGVRVVHVPTTLLGDGRRGGRRQDRHQHRAAARTSSARSTSRPACSATWRRCASLPRAELVAGLGEVIKCGFIADPAILDAGRGRPTRGAITPDSAVLRELVERAIRVKIDVVVADLKETGGADGHPGREVLNYGHTMAHAIERAEDYRIRHGEAVAIGCVYVAELAAPGRHPRRRDRRAAPRGVRAGRPADDVRRRRPSTTCTRAMKVDKKSRGSQLRFVVLDRPRGARPCWPGPSEADLRGGVRRDRR